MVAKAYSSLAERIRNILVSPRAEWPVIEAEPTSVGQLYSRYVVPMTGFAAGMCFIRMSLIGVTPPWGGTIRTPVASGLMAAVMTFILGLIGLSLVGTLINMLAPAFSGERNRRQALKTAAYSLTPAWLGTALSFFPLGSLLQLAAGLYGIYVLYLGLPQMMGVPRAKADGYAVTVVVCTMLVGIVFVAVGALLGEVAQAH
jgi:hypothetical protein